MKCGNCDSTNIKTHYDRDSGRHVVGYTCGECGWEFSKKDKVRDGMTFVLERDGCDGCGNRQENRYAVIDGEIHLCERCEDILGHTICPDWDPDKGE